jgi:CheY-like chemotaxis protein
LWYRHQGTLTLAEVPRPGLILLDLMMARNEWLGISTRKSSDPLIADIPTIVLSGSARPGWSNLPVAKPC